MILSLIYNSFSYYLFLNILILSLIGYGIVFTQVTNFKPILTVNLFHYVLMGLILIGSISMLVNFFIPIHNFYSILIIFIGLLFFQIKHKIIFKNYIEIILRVLSISFISLIFSFYAGFSDDIAYHYNTILNFKNLNIFEIIHSRQVSYNSHWLFLNSIFFITNFNSSIFALTAILYSIILFDLFFIYNKKSDDYNLISVFSFFSLLFLIGVTNIYKDFGTDMPGVLISIFILLNILYLIKSELIIKKDYIFYIILLLNFIFIIKITNSLGYFFLFTFLIIINFKFIKLFSLKLIIIILPILLWFFQNIIISGCLIWPVTPLCFYNSEMSSNELYLIESFAKGDIDTKINVKGFDWILVWLSNHSTKMIETYLLYIILLCLPIVIFKIKNKYFNIKTYIDNYFKHAFYLIIPCIICNVIWFFYTPAYRFGIFYNFTFIFFVLSPFWISIKIQNIDFFKKYTKFLIVIAILFFSYENISKIEWYIDKYGKVWPPIHNSELLVK